MTDRQSLLQTERRRFRRFVAMSAGGHVLAAAMLGFAPSRSLPLNAPVISVDLLASLPRAPSREEPAASAPAPPKSAAKPPQEAPAKAPPKAKKIVLPKQAPSATRKPREVDRPPKRVKPKELDYSDALAKLREDLGESEPAPEVVAQAAPALPAAAPTGVRVEPEVLAWLLEVKRHVRAGWVTPPEFLDRELETRIAVVLAEDGRLLGKARVVKPSGDPFWDDSAVRAIVRAEPLPPPPERGEWQFSFGTQEHQ